MCEKESLVYPMYFNGYEFVEGEPFPLSYLTGKKPEAPSAPKKQEKMISMLDMNSGREQRIPLRYLTGDKPDVVEKAHVPNLKRQRCI